MLEALEPRVVLDGGMAAEVAPVATADAGFERFESADELQQFLVDAAVDRFKNLFGRESNTQIGFPPYVEQIVEPRTALDLAVGTVSIVCHVRCPESLPRTTLDLAVGTVAGVAGSVDGANIQVTGVDEADLVKTDGGYLYIANAGRLSIIDARNPAELSLAAEIPFDSYAAELYVSGDRLVLLSNQSSHVPIPAPDEEFAWFPHVEFRSQPQTSVAIYNIADRTAPVLIQETTIDGNLTASRRIDDLVYLVTSDQLHLPQPEMDCQELMPASAPNWSAEEDDFAQGLPWFVPELLPPSSCTYKSEEAYLERFGDSLVELAMPSYETIDANGAVVASGMISEPTDIYKPLTDHPSSVTLIIVIDLSTETSAISASASLITNSSSTVYASAQNIYVATDSYDDEGHSNTTLQQFAIADDGTTVDLAAVGTVPGSLLNQFAMDEYDGHLRVVTSTGWGEDRTNQLFVLAQLGTSLDVVGSIDEIATGEMVFAVRFVGDEAFVVKFRQIDPLFTIDLSDPTHPAIAGELKIPGSLNYLHPMSEDFVLGMGRDEGSNRDPELSLFDVSDFSMPTRVDKFVFANATLSGRFYHHHAISYFPDSQIAVVPFEEVGGVCVGFTCHSRHVGAFWVIQIDTASDDKSLRLLGTIEHNGAPPLRSLVIGQNLFTVFADSVKVTELLHPATLIDELYLGRIAFSDYVAVHGNDREIKLDVLNNDHVGDDATIFAVSTSATGAAVVISEDGKSLLYTPAENSDAVSDSFDYTVESGGRRETTTVQVHIERESVKDRMIRLAKTDLVDRLGPNVAPHHIHVDGIIEQQWPDSCLGVANDREACAQVITPGFEIVLQYSLAEFIYHTDTTDRVVAVNDPVIDTTALIQFRAEVVNAAGELVTSLRVGEEARLLIYADDLRDHPQGVFAAYFDVLFDATQVAEIGPIRHGSEFVHGQSGTIADGGLIDEVGGFDNEADPSHTLVVSIPFIAASAGELRFTLEGADKSPAHDTLLLRVNSPVPLDRIRFGEVVVEVIESLHNEADPMDANMDGQRSPVDVLVIMNHLNRYGAGPVNAGAVLALRAAAAEAHAEHFAADVNRDGFISPIDVLWIINAFEARTRLHAEGESVAAPATSATSTSVAPVLVTAAAQLPATSPMPAARCADTSPSIDPEALFPLADAIDFVARTQLHHTTPPETASHEDTFFAELELAATGDWWRP